MKTPRIYWLVILLCIGFQSMLAQTADEALQYAQYGLNVGARSQGMGSISIGLANDFSALFTNPAGLAQLRDYEFSFGLSRLQNSNDVTFAGTKMSSDNNATNLSNLGIVYPIATTQGSLTFAFGFGRTANYTSSATFGGFNIQNSYVDVITSRDFLTPQNRKSILDNDIGYQLYLADTLNGYLYPNVTDSVSQIVTFLQGGGMNHWSFGGALDIAENLSLGISLNFASGSLSYDRLYRESDSKNIYSDFSSFTYMQNLSTDLSGFNMLFGLMYRQQGKFRAGITLRTPTHYDVTETFTETYGSSFKSGNSYSFPFDPQDQSYKIITPMVLGAGVSVTPIEWFTLGGDVEYTDWTELEFDSDNQKLKNENMLIKTSLLRSTTNLRGGGEVSLLNYGIKLRGGIIWNPSPYKQDANTTDYDRIYYTAGAGITFEQNTTIDISYAYGFWKWSRPTDDLFSVPQALQTSESVHTNNLNITLSYRF